MALIEVQSQVSCSLWLASIGARGDVEPEATLTLTVTLTLGL